MAIVYPEKFKERVANALNGRENITDQLNEGKENVGKYLYDAEDEFTPEDIVEAVENNTIQELYARAKKQIEINNLYNEWVDLEREQHPERFERSF